MPENFATSADGLLLVANGVDKVLRWDGLADEMENAGVLPPSAAPATAASGTGAITGTYYAYLRFVDDRGNFSDLSPLAAALAASANSTVTYSAVERPAEAKARRRQLLRNTAGQTRVFYVDVDTADLSGTSFSSTKTDAELQASTAVALFDAQNLPLANLNAVPPDTKCFVAAHHERMFLAGEEPYSEGSVAVAFGSATVAGTGTEWPGNFAGRFLWLPQAEEVYEVASVDAQAQTLTLARPYQGATDPYTPYAIRPAAPERRLVYFSEAGLAESWPPTNAVSPQEDGDEITGLMSKGSFLYVLERRHIYKLTFESSPTEDGFVFLTAGRGCVNNRCWCVVDDRAFFLDEAGVYSFQGGQQVEELSLPIQDVFEPPRRGRVPRYRVRWEASRWFHCCYDPGLRVVRWFVTLEGTGVPRHALCLDLQRNAWWVEEYPFPVGASAVGPSRGSRRVFVGGPGGRVYALGQGTLDVVEPDALTCRGTATSAGLRSLTDQAATFTPAAVNAPLTIVAGRGKGQTRAVTAVAAARLTLDRPWLTRPDTSSVYQLGGVEFRFRTGWFRYVPLSEENARRLEVVFEPCPSGGCTLDARLYLDRSPDPVLWGFTQSDERSDGFASEEGSPDLVADLTKPTGLVQRRMDGRKDLYLDGPRFLAWELRGATNADDVSVYQVTIDGVQGRG